MRYEPESTDPANAGLSIVQDLLKPVIANHPELSVADIWCFASCAALEFAGGPAVPFQFGRTDKPDGSHCPANGLLPDATQGAQHLRDVFYRMGFDDRAIVCLSGAHTMGRCHLVRSGFDGPWTHNPLRFDNHYFRNLLNLEWTPKQWDGPLQYQDKSGRLMMLPTDLALINDPQLRPFVEMYANDQALFFRDFAQDYAKLIHNGCPVQRTGPVSPTDQASADLREAAMHGSIGVVKELAAHGADVNGVEGSSGRTALHKAAFWGHEATVGFLVSEANVNPNVQDVSGDTALHDAARFGHVACVNLLLPGTDLSIRNKEGKTALEVAEQYQQPKIVALLNERSKL